MLCLLFADRIVHPLQTGLNDRARHRKIQAHIAFCVADEERIPTLEQNARLVGEEVRRSATSGRQRDRSTHARYVASGMYMTCLRQLLGQKRLDECEVFVQILL